MQIRDQVTPATILAELVSHARAQPADTQGFCHVNCHDLYGRFYAKAERIFASFDKYTPLTWYLWRPGESGTDIAMRYSSESLSGGTDRFIGMRLISSDELAAEDNQATKIGAQIRVTVRNIWVSLAGAYPYFKAFAEVVRNLQAVLLRC